MAGGWVYIMTNRPNGTFYIGVANNLERRVSERRNGQGSQFVRRYYLHRLVFAESHDDIRLAIRRETSFKRWPRAWKVELITAGNPEWCDLAAQFL